MIKKIIFEPYPKQKEFIEAVFSGKYSFLCYGGAMGGGKSYVCLAVLILLARAYPKSKWCVIRESLPTIKKTTLETFKKLVPSNFIKSYNQAEQVYTFTNDSQIFFMAEDFKNDKEFDRFKGLEVNGFLLEQIEELQEKLLGVCFIRAGRWLIDKMPPRPLILANVNPTLLWPKAKVFDRFTKNTLPEDWFYEPAKISDNPVLFNDVNYMHNLTTHLDDITRKRLIDGDWTAFAIDKPYLYKFSIQQHVKKSFIPNPHLPITVSFDFNVEPMTAIVGQKEDVMTGYIFDEFEIKTGSTEEMCDLIIAKYKDWFGNIQVTGDATGRNRQAVTEGNLNHYRVIKDKFKLKDYDLLVPKQNPAHKDSRVLGNSVLQHADFYITENCEKTKMDCIYAQVDEFGDLIKTKDQGRHCFSGDTKIITIGGEKKIKDVLKGDFVLTRYGFRRVLEHFNNGQHQVCEIILTLCDNSKIKLLCTQNHKVLTNLGWFPISQLSPGMMVYQHNYLEEGFTNYTQVPDISSQHRKNLLGCMLRFGHFIIIKSRLKDSMFTIWMKIRQIINQAICNCLNLVNTCLTTCKKGFWKIQNISKNLEGKQFLVQLNGVKQRLDLNSEEHMWQKYSPLTPKYLQKQKSIWNANIVEENIKQYYSKKPPQNIVQTIVKAQTEEKEQSIISKGFVQNAGLNSSSINIQELKHVHVVAVLKEVTVYDLHILQHHEYFANGLLVHNCFDNFRYIYHAWYPDFIKNPNKYKR